MGTNLKISVSELIEIFRGALISIIPWLEKVKIKWRAGESYDDWDNIAQALYENIVCASLVGEVLSEYSISKYDFHYDDYSRLNYIGVKSKEHPEKNLVFVSFQSKSLLLDIIKAAILDRENKVAGHLMLIQEGVKFVYVKNKKGETQVVDNLDVTL